MKKLASETFHDRKAYKCIRLVLIMYYGRWDEETARFVLFKGNFQRGKSARYLSRCTNTFVKGFQSWRKYLGYSPLFSGRIHAVHSEDCSFHPCHLHVEDKRSGTWTTDEPIVWLLLGALGICMVYGKEEKYC